MLFSLHCRHTTKEKLGRHQCRVSSTQILEHRCYVWICLSKLTPGSFLLEQHQICAVTEQGETYWNVTLSFRSFSCTSHRFLNSKVVSVAGKLLKLYVGNKESQSCAPEMKEKVPHQFCLSVMSGDAQFGFLLCCLMLS